MSMTFRAAGTFDVKTTLLPPDEPTGGPAIGRYALKKQFHGDLQAAGKGEMLGSGSRPRLDGYVAIEIITGTMHGRKRNATGLNLSRCELLAFQHRSFNEFHQPIAEQIRIGTIAKTGNSFHPGRQGDALQRPYATNRWCRVPTERARIQCRSS